MCRRYVPIYQCRHRDHAPQPEVYLCRRALDAFAWQTKKDPIVSATNGSFVLQKLAARTAGCLRESTTELDLFYQVTPEWCDVCLANGHATLRAALIDDDALPFKRADVGAWIPWKHGVEVPRRDHTEAQERVWVEDPRQRPVRKYWRTVPAHNSEEDGEGNGRGYGRQMMQSNFEDKTTWGLTGCDGKGEGLTSRCSDLISLIGNSPETGIAL